MSRLIDADEVKKYYETRFPEIDNGVHWSRNDIIMNLDNIETADIAPVIRCKDCHFYKSENLQCMMHDGDLDEWYDNDYCSRAERKEE